MIRIHSPRIKCCSMAHCWITRSTPLEFRGHLLQKLNTRKVEHFKKRGTQGRI